MQRTKVAGPRDADQPGAASHERGHVLEALQPQRVQAAQLRRERLVEAERAVGVDRGENLKQVARFIEGLGERRGRPGVSGRGGGHGRREWGG